MECLPTEQAFILDPISRFEHCVKVLCGNVGVLADIESDVLRILCPTFLEILSLPQSERARAEPKYLTLLKCIMTCRGVYLRIGKISANASSWTEYEYAFTAGSFDATQPCVLMYIGSATRTISGFHVRVELEHMDHRYRKRYHELHYAGMEEPGATDEWLLLGETDRDDDRATIRIAEGSNSLFS